MRIQITNGMLIALIVNMVFAKAIGLTQGIAAREANSDMWLATLLATLQGIAIMMITVRVQRRTPTLNVMEQAGLLFGKWAGRALGLLIILFFLGAYGSVMITFVYHLMDYFLPEMPILIFVIVGTLVGAYAIRFGLEVIARMALVGLLSIICLNLLILFGAMSEFDVRELLPLFENGFVNTVKASRHNDTDWAMATMMAAIILPQVKQPKVWKRSAPLGILIGGCTVMLWPILEAGVLSPEVTGQYIVACMQLARSAEIGQFIHRYEMIMIAFFATSALVQIMISLLAASIAAAHVFHLKDYRPMIIPIALLFAAGGYFAVLDHNRAMTMLADYWPPIALSISIGLPLAMWGLGFLRKKKWQKQKPEHGRQDAA